MIRDGEVFALVVGSSLSPSKWGLDYNDIVKLNGDGRVKETLYSEGQVTNANKKGGRSGKFTSSSQFCILTPLFENDEWKGMPRLFDLLSKEVIQVKPPKGYAKFRILDHFEDKFWIMDWDKNIACCEAEISND